MSVLWMHTDTAGFTNSNFCSLQKYYTLLLRSLTNYIYCTPIATKLYLKKGNEMQKMAFQTQQHGKEICNCPGLFAGVKKKKESSNVLWPKHACSPPWRIAGRTTWIMGRWTTGGTRAIPECPVTSKAPSLLENIKYIT